MSVRLLCPLARGEQVAHVLIGKTTHLLYLACHYPVTLIATLSTPQVTIAYIDTLQPRPVRQEILWQSYNFHCTCSRCQEGMQVEQELHKQQKQQNTLQLRPQPSAQKEGHDGFVIGHSADWFLQACDVQHGALALLQQTLDEAQRLYLDQVCLLRAAILPVRRGRRQAAYAGEETCFDGRQVCRRGCWILFLLALCCGRGEPRSASPSRTQPCSPCCSGDWPTPGTLPAWRHMP